MDADIWAEGQKDFLHKLVSQTCYMWDPLRSWDMLRQLFLPFSASSWSEIGWRMKRSLWLRSVSDGDHNGKSCNLGKNWVTVHSQVHGARCTQTLNTRWGARCTLNSQHKVRYARWALGTGSEHIFRIGNLNCNLFWYFLNHTGDPGGIPDTSGALDKPSSWRGPSKKTSTRCFDLKDNWGSLVLMWVNSFDQIHASVSTDQIEAWVQQIKYWQKVKLRLVEISVQFHLGGLQCNAMI